MKCSVSSVSGVGMYWNTFRKELDLPIGTCSIMCMFKSRVITYEIGVCHISVELIISSRPFSRSTCTSRTLITTDLRSTKRGYNLRWWNNVEIPFEINFIWSNKDCNPTIRWRKSSLIPSRSSRSWALDWMDFAYFSVIFTWWAICSKWCWFAFICLTSSVVCSE